MSCYFFLQQAKYQKACDASSVRIVTPDWIIHSVDSLSRIDEIRYHPRLLLTGELAQQAVSATSPVQSLSQHNYQPDVEPANSVAVSDTTVYAIPYVVTAVHKPVSVVPVPVIPTTPVSQQHVRTHLKSIGNGNEYVTEVGQSPLKPFGSAKVCISRC